MQVKRIAIAALFCVGSAFSQDADTGMPNDDRFRVPEALQQAVGLSDMQIEQLRENNLAMVEEVRPLAPQLAEKFRQLRRETTANSPNESIIGTVTLEIIEINRAIDAARARYQESARAFLNALQIEALGPIEAAADDVYAVRQAAQFNLIVIPDEGATGAWQSRRRQQTRGRC